MIQNYIVDKLTLSDLTETGKVIIPNFQRGIVWTKTHRKEFIETVKSGDPFGVVLVSQEAPGEPYYLIDGLQRLSTLKAYMNNPLEFIDENDKFIDQERLHKVFVEKYKAKGLSLPPTLKLDKEKKRFLKKIIARMRKEETIPKDRDIWKDVSEILDVAEKDIDVYYAYADFHDSFIKNLQLPDIIIHAIVYQGAKERLPYVFETLNTSSVSLTKYEVFSSKWPTLKVPVKDEVLIQKVWSKYDGLKKSSSFDVDITEDDIRNNGMTLFEYCFGFSELVSDPNTDYSFLFNNGKKSTDPTGFELLALACGLAVNKADDLYKNDYLGSMTAEALVDLKNALMESIQTVASALHDWVYDFNGSPIKISGTYQIYFMIISVFNHLYDYDPKKGTISRKDDKTWVDGFRVNAHKWYLFQLLSGYWNQHRQVGDLRSLLDRGYLDTGGYVDYGKSITIENWNDALTAFFDNQENCNSRDVPAETKLFLNVLYRMLIQEDKNRIKYFERQSSEGELAFDIEHIVPVSRFSKFDEDFMISSIGNLCYLPVKDNRSKRDKTIYEYAADRPSLVFNSDFIEMIDYPSKQELSFIDAPIDQFRTSYESLIETRSKKVLNRFLDLIV